MKKLWAVVLALCVTFMASIWRIPFLIPEENTSSLKKQTTNVSKDTKTAKDSVKTGSGNFAHTNRKTRRTVFGNSNKPSSPNGD